METTRVCRDYRVYMGFKYGPLIMRFRVALSLLTGILGAFGDICRLQKDTPRLRAHDFKPSWYACGSVGVSLRRLLQEGP